ncbi:hypothetical protein BC937DRAFT_91768 [Endogone sp. FLAS-F59071]|nr:hypothetical protein BC937DRAFT_91768 [Endogone sp. FLAS-F59071]|eukprot:RUS15950.1 hypothetical protein BC937DRAFT_91768 [Endogone sp. FLAS-F59071]
MGNDVSKIKHRMSGRSIRAWNPIPAVTRTWTSSMEVRASNAPTTAMEDIPDFRWMEGRKYHAVKGSSYFLPRDNQEVDRLVMQHYMVKAIFEGNTLEQVTPLLEKKDATVLDVGYSKSQIALDSEKQILPPSRSQDVASEYSHAECHAIDMCAVFPESVKPTNVTFTKCNVLEGLPFPDKSFDVVHMRSLIFGLRAGEWPSVLAEIFRVVKPGGMVQLVESEIAYITPDPGCYTHMEKLCSILSSLGQDPFIALHLEALVPAAGFEFILHEKRSIAVGWKGKLSEIWFDDAMAIGQATKGFFAPALGMNGVEYDIYIKDLINKLRTSRSYTNWHAVVGRRPI